MLHFARITKWVAAGVCWTAITASNATMPTLSLAATGSAVLALSSFVADSAEARPRKGGGGRSRAGGNHRQPGERRATAPRRHHYDDRRDFIRRRHALGFLYAATLPHGCSTVVVLNDGVQYYHCGAAYYRPYMDNGTTIYVIRE